MADGTSFETTAILDVEVDDAGLRNANQLIESELGATEVGVTDGGTMGAQVARGGGRSQRRARREFRWARERTDLMEEGVAYLESIDDQVGEGGGGMANIIAAGGRTGALAAAGGGLFQSLAFLTGDQQREGIDEVLPGAGGDVVELFTRLQKLSGIMGPGFQIDAWQQTIDDLNNLSVPPAGDLFDPVAVGIGDVVTGVIDPEVGDFITGEFTPGVEDFITGRETPTVGKFITGKAEPVVDDFVSGSPITPGTILDQIIGGPTRGQSPSPQGRGAVPEHIRDATTGVAQATPRAQRRYLALREVQQRRAGESLDQTAEAVEQTVRNRIDNTVDVTIEGGQDIQQEVERIVDRRLEDLRTDLEDEFRRAFGGGF